MGNQRFTGNTENRVPCCWNNPVYAFMDKKRADGMPYYVYMTAGANKFLRIYYGKVNAFLAPKEDAGAEADESDS